ncbi:hypothetical protein [Enterobacter sp. FB]|uniref:hypothetical protein n=1 Tax=Enterobacter sp. FB TaxID=1571816 RepID=UPI00057E59C2|nr:hypothetical protein [Enterobacter sp. FB]OIR48098.1 hypothetical protein BH716_21545 [Lelliottia nimipressuralis]
MKALALFGSTARYEREIDSDIDLLGVYDKATIHCSSESIVNLYLYPEEIIIKKMVSGDLFALHLVKEAIPIYGTEYFKEIFSNFRYKKDYSYEIGTALFIGNILIKNYASIINKAIVNKKLAWCLRTVVIAISAEEKKPVFSKKYISEYLKLKNLNANEVLYLINTKRIKYALQKESLEKYYFFFDEISRRYHVNGNYYSDPLVLDILSKVGLISPISKGQSEAYS